MTPLSLAPPGKGGFTLEDPLLMVKMRLIHSLEIYISAIYICMNQLHAESVVDVHALQGGYST